MSRVSNNFALVVLVCLAGVVIAKLKPSADFSFMKFMLESRGFSQDSPQRSMDCFDYYVPQLNAITAEYEKTYAVCLGNSEAAKVGVDDSTSTDRAEIEFTSQNACQLLSACNKHLNTISYFECYQNGGSENTKTMYTISRDSSDILDRIREQYRLIDNEEYSCTNASERAYVEQTTSTYEQLQSCLQGKSPVPMKPTTEQPTTEQPTTEHPTTVEPTTKQPTTINPTTEQPTTAEPNTKEPTTEQLTTENSTPKQTTDKSTTEKPKTEQPTTEQPTTVKPTTEQPTTEKLPTDEPTQEKSTTEQSTQKSTSNQPTTEQSTTEEPTSKQPTKDETTTTTTDQNATEEPTTSRPRTDHSTTELSTSEQPITDQTTTEVPTTDHPTTDHSTTELSISEQPTTDQTTTTEEPTTDENISTTQANNSSGTDSDELPEEDIFRFSNIFKKLLSHRKKYYHNLANI